MSPSDIVNALRSLSRLKKGDPVRKAASSDRMNAIQNLLQSLARGDNVVAGPNIRKKLGEGFFILSAEPKGKKGGGGETEIPFQVVKVPPDPNNTTPGDLIGVISNSHLFNSEDRDVYEEDNSNWGLLQDDIPPGDQAAWKNNYLGDKIFLVIELDQDQVIQNIDIGHGPVGTEENWTQYPDPIEINTDNPDNTFQQFYHQLIAEITDPDTDPRPGFTITNDAGQSVQVTQCLFNNIMMTTAHTTHDADQPDLPLLVAVPWGMFPGTSTDGEADEINDDPDVSTPWQFGSVEAENHYDFEMVNASDEDGPKVLIYDGVVYTANNPASDPNGMPSDNSFILPVDDGDEVWVGFTYENDLNFEITSCFIDHGSQTPDDDPNSNTAYVTIGHVDVQINEPDGIDVVTPFNEVCGDINWQPPRFDIHFDFQLEDASEGSDPIIRIYDGVVIGPNDDPVDPAGMPTEGNSYQLPVNDGDEIYVGVQWDLESDDGVSGDNIESAWIGSGTTPDDEGLIQYITLGHVDVNFAGDENIAQVYPYNEVLGDIEIPYPPSMVNVEDPETLQLSVDKDTGDVVWKTSKIAQVTAEDTAFDGESGAVLLPDIDVLTFDSNDFSVWDGMGGQAVITVNGDNALQVHGSDGSTVMNVNEITFAVASDPSAGFIHVEDDGGGNAIVQIPILPTTGGGIQVLGSDDGDIQWFSTDQCSD